MLLGWGNRTDDALLNDGAWTTTLPLVNLQNRTIGKVARSNDAQLTSTKFKADIGSDEIVRMLALVGHNFELDAQYRIRSSEVSDFSVVETDSGWTDVWSAVYPPEVLDWEATNFWSGQYLPREIAGYNNTLIYILPTSNRAQFWSVEIADTTNSDGYVQIGRLFIGDAWQPSRNLSVGAVSGLETDTNVQRARSGAEYFDRRRTRRASRFTIANISDDESYGSAYEIIRQMGTDGEVVFIFDPDDTVHAIRRQYFGRLRQLGSVDHPYPLDQSVGWEIQELL